MDPTAIILSSLTATSLLLCVALAMAWQCFGRERHAAIWSAAFGLSTATWAVNLLSAWMPAFDTPLTLLASLTSIGCFALIALGFRRRVGLPERAELIIMIGAAVSVLAGWVVIWSTHAGFVRALIVFFCAAMLIVSALSLRADPQDGRRRTGGAAFWMLASFAGYDLLLGIVALCASGPADLSYRLYRLMLLLGVPTGLFGVGLFAMFLLAADLADGMRQLAASDPLTGILNRRGFEQAAVPLVAQSKRHARTLAVVMADLDRFKTINDRFGHGVGDAVLQCFASHVGKTIREGDLFGRMGGEEFVLVLPDTGGSEAIEAIERIRAGLDAAVRDLVPSARITASFGIALLDQRGDTLSDAMGRADRALYDSKMTGRDRITLAAAATATALRTVTRRVA